MREKITINFGNRTIKIEDPRDVYKKYNKAFDEDDNNKTVEEILKDVFRDKAEALKTALGVDNYIVLKVTLLNEYYSTQIPSFNLKKVAKRISKIEKFDTLIKSEKIEDRARLVHQIAFEEKNNDGAGNYYSFATKYCSWHCHENYPIVDSYAAGLLYRLNTQGRNDSTEQEEPDYYFYKKVFSQPYLKNYINYCKVYERFSKFVLGIHDEEEANIDYKEIDKYIWMYVVTRFSPKHADIEDDIKKNNLIEDRKEFVDDEVKKAETKIDNKYNNLTKAEKKNKTHEQLDKEKEKEKAKAKEEAETLANRKFINKEFRDKFKVSL